MASSRSSANKRSNLKKAELLAPTAELRRTLGQLRREIEILKRREQIRETQLQHWRSEVAQAGRLQQQFEGEIPKISGAKISCWAHPAEGVSGDLHMVRRISPDSVAIMVADASGHGLAAGLLSAVLMGSIQARRGGQAVDLSNPAEVLADLHQTLMQCQLPDCEFVTALLAVYNERTRVFRFARAGAPHPMLLQRESRPRPLVVEGLPLGVDGAGNYQSIEIELAPTDQIVLYTDGLESLAHVPGNEASTDPIPAIVDSIGGACTDGRLDDFMRSTRHQIEGEHDDITVVSLVVENSKPGGL